MSEEDVLARKAVQDGIDQLDASSCLRGMPGKTASIASVSRASLGPMGRWTLTFLAQKQSSLMQDPCAGILV